MKYLTLFSRFASAITPDMFGLDNGNSRSVFGIDPNMLELASAIPFIFAVLCFMNAAEFRRENNKDSAKVARNFSIAWIFLIAIGVFLIILTFF